jgi:hypothetical protein
LSEAAQAFGWIVSTCQADTALMAVAVGGVWVDRADIGTIAPYVLIVAQDPGTDTLTMNAIRLFVRGLYQIKMVGPSSKYADLVTGTDRIDALFKSRSSVALSPSGGILACYREQVLAYPDPNLINGQAWSHLGGLYNIDLQAS